MCLSYKNTENIAIEKDFFQKQNSQIFLYLNVYLHHRRTHPLLSLKEILVYLYILLFLILGRYQTHLNMECQLLGLPLGQAAIQKLY